MLRGERAHPAGPAEHPGRRRRGRPTTGTAAKQPSQSHSSVVAALGPRQPPVTLSRGAIAPPTCRAPGRWRRRSRKRKEEGEVSSGKGRRPGAVRAEPGGEVPQSGAGSRRDRPAGRAGTGAELRGSASSRPSRTDLIALRLQAAPGRADGVFVLRVLLLRGGCVRGQGVGVGRADRRVAALAL